MAVGDGLARPAQANYPVSVVCGTHKCVPYRNQANQFYRSKKFAI
jgi:hypothetical protein